MIVKVISDPLFDDYGPCRPPVLTSKVLHDKGYDVCLISPYISQDMENAIVDMGVDVVNLGMKMVSKSSSYVWLESWLKETLFGSNGKAVLGRSSMDGCVVNFSGTVMVPSDLWYISGTVSEAVDNMVPTMSWYYRLLCRLLKPLLRWGDDKFLKAIGKSKRVVANSQYCSESYKKEGMRVDAVIYPPLDLSVFRPSTRRPSRDYVAAYLGKETSLDVLRRLADSGIKLKLFGGKMWRSANLSNAEFMGHLGYDELVDLYSNAIYTAFPFTDEYFGYVPSESMACGTPVLTYGRQGPKESVLDGLTGWLCNDEDDFLKKGLEIWRTGFPEMMDSECVKRAAAFDKQLIGDEWDSLIRSVTEQEIFPVCASS